MFPVMFTVFLYFLSSVMLCMHFYLEDDCFSLVEAAAEAANFLSRPLVLVGQVFVLSGVYYLGKMILAFML